MSNAKAPPILPLLLAWGLATLITYADQVVMQNGDQYNGRILSVSPTNVVLQSENLGVVNLTRGKVASLSMGLSAVTNSPMAVPVKKTSAPTELPAVLRQMANQSNLINQVRSRFLATAGPEANQKFDQLLGDLGSGKLSLADLRAQAKSAAAQLRELEQAGGEDASGMMGLYLSVLDNFLAESESETVTPAATTNAAPRKP